MGWKEIEEEISKYRPDVVGISCLFSLQSKNSHKIAKIAKKVGEDIVVVAGGAHPSKETKLISIIRRLYHIRSFDDMRLTWKFVHGARKLSQGIKIICIT